MMFSNKRRDREIYRLQQDVERLDNVLRKLRCDHARLLKHLGLQEFYIKEEIILVAERSKP